MKNSISARNPSLELRMRLFQKIKHRFKYNWIQKLGGLLGVSVQGSVGQALIESCLWILLACALTFALLHGINFEYHYYRNALKRDLPQVKNTG